MRTLVLGGSGLLGQAFVAALGPEAHATHFQAATPSRSLPSATWHQLDLAAAGNAERLIELVEPDLVVNAAYVAAGEQLQAVTATVPGELATATQRRGCKLVHISTDVVFAGDRTEPYAETDTPAPVHAYGEAKLASEVAVSSADPDALIVRTSLLFGGATEHAQEALIRRAVAVGDITFFTDEVRCPIAVDDLAAAIIHLVDLGAAGIWHVAGPDALDRLAFAQLLAASIDIDPDLLRGGPSNPKSVRPRHVVLDSSRAIAAGVSVRSVADVLGQ